MKTIAAQSFLLLSALVACATSSCSDSGTGTSPTGTKKLRVAVIPKGTAHEFWKAVEKGARRADQELADLEIVWKGPTGEGDTTGQIQLVENFTADGYDGICLAPLDARGLINPARNAIAKGIPVVIFDSGLEPGTAAISTTVATDNFHGGEIAGEELAQRLGGKGRVLVLRYLVGSESTTQREEGCLAALAKHADIAVISKDKHAGPDETKAIEVSESLLATFGETLDGVFCSNESSVSGFLTALQRDPRKLGAKITVVGFDSSTNIVRALEDGRLAATVLQDPVTMGYKAVMAMHAVLTKKPVEARISTGETLATKATMNSGAVKALLNPLQ